MKVLLSASACHPELGSEGGLGWKAATALAKQHQVHVMTSVAERGAVERVLSSGAYPNLSFTFFGTDAPYHANRLIARLQSWTRYMSWLRQSLEVAQGLAGQCRFDLAHHVTISSWRVPSPLWQLSLPFIWTGRRSCRLSCTTAAQAGPTFGAFRADARRVKPSSITLGFIKGLRPQCRRGSRLQCGNLR